MQLNWRVHDGKPKEFTQKSDLIKISFFDTEQGCGGHGGHALDWELRCKHNNFTETG